MNQALSTLPVFIHFSQHCCGYNYYLHFADKEAERQRHNLPSITQQVVELIFLIFTFQY